MTGRVEPDGQIRGEKLEALRNNSVFHDSHKTKARRLLNRKPTDPLEAAKNGSEETAAPTAASGNASIRWSRTQIRVIGEALALQQTHAQLPEPLRNRLTASLPELDRLVTRLRALLVEVARPTPPGA